jgi:hypothetical protein
VLAGVNDTEVHIGKNLFTALRRHRMMRVVVPLVLCAALVFPLVAGSAEEEQEPGWNNEMIFNFNLTQAGFDNWAGGGENTLGWQAGLNGKFTHLGDRHEWVNTAKLAYGMQKVGDEEARKSVDEIKIETVYTYKSGFYVDPYVAATAQTQFSNGFLYEDSRKAAISGFLDPGYFTQSAGIGRSYGAVLRSRLGFAAKETVTDKYPVPYADDPETEDEIEDTKVELGMESVTDLSLTLGENLVFTSKLELFSNLEASNQIDVAWDNLLAAKVQEYVSVSLNVKMVYDRDVSTKRQLRQSLAIGLTYTLL